MCKNMDQQRYNSRRARPDSLPLRIRRLQLRRERNHSPPPTPSIWEAEVSFEVPYLYVSASVENLEKRLMDCTEKLVRVRKLHEEIEQETELLTKAIKFVHASVATESNCSVCLEELQKSDIAVLSNCCHIFHVSCLRTWFATSLTCPSCRQSAKNKDMRRVSPEQAKMFEDLARNERLKLVQLLAV